jgi:formylmethanofuran dehydrogenase subunit E
MENWKVIDDKKVRSRWECAECNEGVYVAPWFYSEMGEPFCVDCEREMEYIRTEVNNG